MSWLDTLFFGVKGAQNATAPLPQRPILNFGSGLTATDDPVSKVTTVTANASGLTGQSNITLINGLNSNIPVPTNYLLRVSGPTAPFAIGGFNAPLSPGVPLVIKMLVTAPCTVVHLDGVSAVQIKCPGGSDFRVPSGAAQALTLVYDSASGCFQFQAPGASQPAVDISRDFGAYGDGVHDDTSAIDALNQFLKSSAKLVNGTWAGRTVHFPQGVYLTSHQINLDFTAVGYPNQHPNTTIRGIGKGQSPILRQGSTILYTGSGSPVLGPTSFITGSNPSAVSITGSPSRNVHMIVAIDFAGAQGVATFKWSLDGGLTYTTGVLTAPTVALGATGLSASFAVATYTTADAWTAYTVDSIISARSSLGFTLEDIAVLYTQSSYTGDIVDLGVFPGTSNESGIFHVEGCTLGSDSASLTTGRDCINLDGANAGDVTKCQFNGATNGIRGNKAAGGFGQTNQITVDKCTFGALLTEAGIANPGTQAIVIRESTFESTPQAVRSDYFAEANCIGFTFSGNWCGDAPSAYRNLPWIDLTNLPVSGGIISGNFFAQIFSGDVGPGLKSKDSIKLAGGCIEITGNTIGTVDFTTAGNPANTPSEISVHHNILISGDGHGGGAPDSPWFRNYAEANNRGEIYGNIDSTGSFDYTLDTRIVKGHLITFPGRGQQPTTDTYATGITSVTLDGGPDALHGSNDTAGQLTIVVATATAAGDQFLFHYAKAYDFGSGVKMPRIFLQPANPAAAAAAPGNVWADANRVAYTEWAFRAELGLAPGTYTFNYWIVD